MILAASAYSASANSYYINSKLSTPLRTYAQWLAAGVHGHGALAASVSTRWAAAAAANAMAGGTVTVRS